MLDTFHNNSKPFYRNLGKLFYAIAAADGTVREEELNMLQKLAKHDWLNTNIIDPKFKADAEHALTSTFNWLNDDKEYNAERCYQGFLNFKNANGAFFNKKINSLIMKTASKIASSFSGTNKSELILLAKLDMALKKDTNEK